MNKFEWTDVSIDKRIIRQSLDYIIMKLLKERSFHGYGLILFLRKKYGYYFGPSTIYPILDALRKKGCVVSRYELDGERPRKVCVLTEKGVATLKNMEVKLNSIRSTDVNVAVLVDVVTSN